jgi:glyoxylase-like metal-dependent hydrolase (beta-lactamase superfamily II)
MRQIVPQQRAEMSVRSLPLRYDVFVAPELPFVAAPPSRVTNSDPPAWDAKSATLIYGQREAVLVDALLTVREATVLADWINLHDRRLTTIYITHGHGDHFLGLSVLLDRFPGTRAVATAGSIEIVQNSIKSEGLDRGFRAWFPNLISDTIVVPEPLESMQLELEGRPLLVVDTGHTDVANSTSLHVPDLDLIVAGDVVYNRCHMFLGATTPQSRAEWISALDTLAALRPAAVVAGHKDPTQGNAPSTIDESRAYIEFYSEQRDAGLSDQELFDVIVARYPDWVSRQEFLILPWAPQPPSS